MKEKRNKIEKSKCGYCSNKLKENKCRCGAIWDGDKFTHPTKPSLYPSKNGTTIRLNTITGEWDKVI